MKRAVFALATLALMVGAFAQGAPASQKDIDTLKTLETKYEAAKKTYESKKDKKNEKAFVDAAVLFGHESMVSPVLKPNVKYKQALKLYREALKLDPKNKVASTELKLIEDIYKQMGRPIPK